MFKDKRKNDIYSTINYQELMFRVNGSKELLNQIIGIYLKLAPILLMRIDEGLRRKDGNQVRQATHNLKGMVSNFAAYPVVDAIKAIEVLVENGDFSQWESLAHSLKEEIAILDNELRQLESNKNQILST